MREERVYRIPIEEIKSLLMSKYNIDLSQIDAYIDGDDLAFCVTVEREIKSRKKIDLKQTKQTSKKRGKSRRRRRKRSRIKTRGWKVIAKITNDRGLVANVYDPFVKELEGKEISRSEQRKIVRTIMLKNKNRPSEESVDYYLDNTLEYLQKKKEEGKKK